MNLIIPGEENAINAVRSPLAPDADDLLALRLFAYFNVVLFDGELPPCPITVYHNDRLDERLRGPGAYHDTPPRGPRIALMPHVGPYTLCEFCAILVHEMVHHWQHIHGDWNPDELHDAEWRRKLRSIGLRPIRHEDGSCGHEELPGGRFAIAFDDLPASLFLLTPEPSIPAKGGAAL